MKNFIDWLLLIGFAMLLIIWAFFEIAEKFLFWLLDELDKKIDRRISKEKSI